MNRRGQVRPFVMLAALICATAVAVWVPNDEGGLLPGAAVLLFLTARLLRRSTSPASRRA